MSRGRDRRPAPRAPPKARTRAYRLRDAAPDRMSAADWPGQNSSPKAEADGQDAAPSSRQTTPSAAMAPGGHAVPATLLCPGSANPLVPAERVTCNHGNAAAPPRACVLRHPSQAVSWAERAEAGAWGRGLGRSRGGALAWGGAWKAGPGVCGRGRLWARASWAPVSGVWASALRPPLAGPGTARALQAGARPCSRPRAPHGDPPPARSRGSECFAAPPPLFITGARLGERGEPHGASAAGFVARERGASPALPSRLCGCLPGVTWGGSMPLSLRGKKEKKSLCEYL